MKIVVIDSELPGYVCTDFLDGSTMKPLTEEQTKQLLSAMDKENMKKWLPDEDSEIYFVNVRDETWNKFKTKNSKRLELLLHGLIELIKESSWLILIKGNRAKACMHDPEHDPEDDDTYDQEDDYMCDLEYDYMYDQEDDDP
jgi:hypothetical protein